MGHGLADETVNKIVLKSVNWVGDTILTMPAIRAVRERFPAARITAIAPPWVAALLRINPDVDDVWEADARTSWREFMRLARRIRAEHFDLGISFPNSFAAALLLWAGGVRRRVGYARDGRGLLLTDRVRVRPALLRTHEVHYHLHLLSALGGVPESPPPLVLKEDERARVNVDRLLEAERIGPQTPLIGLNPCAFYGSAKRWLPQRFAAVGRHFAEAMGGVAIVTGSRDERPAAQAVCDAVGARARNLAGRLDLAEMASLIRRATLFVTNDSGTMHVAAAVGARTAAVFGPTDSATTAPWSENAILVRREVLCAPCMLRHCPIDHRCMERVQVADVIEAIQRRWPELKV